MTVSPISSTDLNSSLTQNTQSATKAMDKEAFLKLLVAEISHQDPLQPTQGTEFVTQLAQFSQVEQAISQTKQLESVNSQMQTMLHNEGISLVGKSVTTSDQKTGTVTKVLLGEGNAKAVLDSGATVDISQINGVGIPQTPVLTK
jgi:flagellar basal-body rod modification protein FlgD